MSTDDPNDAEPKTAWNDWAAKAEARRAPSVQSGPASIGDLIFPVVVGCIVQAGGMALAIAQWPDVTGGQQKGSQFVADLGLVISGIGGILALIFVIAIGVAVGMQYVERTRTTT